MQQQPPPEGTRIELVLPNTNPVVHNKTQVEYIVQKSKGLAVNIHPLGAVTKACEGKELAEMYDMYSSGACAFSDGNYPVQSAGLMVKSTAHVKAFNGVVIQVPADKTIGQFGLMHEGIMSTKLGLPGVPALAEELMVAREILSLHVTQTPNCILRVLLHRNRLNILDAQRGRAYRLPVL